MMIYGLIGKSLGHSFSQDFFTRFFREHKIVADYRNFELQEIKEVEELLKSGLSGLNVTIPYKEAVIPFLNTISEEARAIGAVNCVQFKNGLTIGHNTDAYGFHQSVKPFLTNKHERALVLGTGGASKAIIHVLTKIGIDVIQISRTPSGPKQFAYSEMNEHMIKACKLIVNCTPVGMAPATSTMIELPYQHLTSDHLVVDLIYNPPMTLFLQESSLQGAMILNGESMLRHQALRSWLIWNDELK
jgi:shikimate dehydrogenase